MLKKIVLILIVLLIAVFAAIKFMSAPNLPKAYHTAIIDYENPELSKDSALNVMTYNIGYLSGMTNNRPVKRNPDFFDAQLRATKKLVRDFSPNILSFQEIDFASNRSFYVNQLDSIALSGMYRVGYKSVNWDKKYVPFPYWPFSNHFGQMVSGQAVLSTHPIVDVETVVLSAPKQPSWAYRKFYIERLLQLAKINFLGQEVVVMNVHLEAFDQETRLIQIEAVKAYYEKYAADQPVILMGDFNSKIPELADGRDAIEILMDAEWIASAIPFDKHSQNNTYSSEEPVRMIDYIFYNTNFLECDSARVIPEAEQISDHLPIWGSLSLKKER